MEILSFVKPKTLWTKMAVFSFLLFLVAITVGGYLIIQKVTYMFEEEIGMRAMAIARTLAQMDEIQNNIGNAGGWEVIQPIAEKTRLATGVAYIVVLDMQRIRYSHPVQERIGKVFTDKDVSAALANHEYISRAEGVLGPSIRAFVPIKIDEGNRQVGVVVVGVLTPTVAEVLRSVNLQIYSFLAVGLLIGLMGSLFLARNIKRAMFSMEPDEIARLLQERTAIFQAMDEGVIAIDTNCRITIINNKAKNLLGFHSDAVGKLISELIPNASLPRVINTGEPEHNREAVINNTIIISNRVPVKVNEEIVGAVATFRDKTEVHSLAEELTGVKAFVEALRVQNHEYMNKLHTIAGLIQLKHYEQAIDYIFDITEEQHKITSLISKRIKDFRLAGMLLGKYARAKELKIKLIINKKSYLDKLPENISSNSLVIIVGNLLENAFDSVRSEESKRRKVYFEINEVSDYITIIVKDWGNGIEPGKEEEIFQHGYSTKGKGRGIGLYLVKRNVSNLKGDIRIVHPKQRGMKFIVRLPILKKSEDAGYEY